ncbi:MAG: hypothetical protein CMO12_03275 [Thaumarchaeota archaeon]|jgi:TusA-related sulfurtransferase|nr:hypothetical protein [Nitrososphaerota archaeon]|tara:strand:+ start:1008 stop:1244 length:237 start_codon:yes stop_codon:yes gene_type:complete
MEVHANNTVDAIGQVCPWPVMLTMKQLRKMKKDEILEVKFDYPPSLQTIPDAVQKEGHTILKTESSEEGFFRITVRRK